MIEGTWFIGLLTPNGTEIDGPGYTRVPVTLSNGRNDLKVVFSAATGAWGQIGYWGLFESAKSVKAVALSACHAHVSSGDTLEFGFDFIIDLNPPVPKPVVETPIIVDEGDFAMLRDKAKRAWQAITDIEQDVKGIK